jgi:Predicted ATPase, RNase L inhibitor (RLI) homolog
MLTVNINKCDGCGRCAASCPGNVFILREISQAEYSGLNLFGRLKIKAKGRLRSYVLSEAGCVECGTCVSNCHERAIKIV